MGRLRSGRLRLLTAIILLLGVCGCGGHSQPAISPFPVKVTLSPSGSTSLQLGGFIGFSATAQNSSNNNVNTSFTFTSSDTSILNIAPSGAGCAGVWDLAFTTCTPGAVGVVQVTATALGTTSPPTYVFVHPPIDNITVTGILLDGQPIQQPCLSQGQTMTIEAHAFSKGSDITTSVGPFSFSANNNGVVAITPLVNTSYNFPTNQATAKAATPGITQIFASANGVSSTVFQQPPPGTNLGFFETCPIQNITLEVGFAGSGQNSFAVSKGTPETIVATVTDALGNSSLVNPNGGVVLSKIPLTWSSTQPGVVNVGSACALSCAVSTSSAGSAAITASCAPPTCNIGFPLAPPGSIAPAPVYALPPTPSGTQPPKVIGAISALITGATAFQTISASSFGCSLEAPVSCGTAIYNFGAGSGQTGAATLMPVAPNSLQFDALGDKIYMGSDYGAQVINPANLGTANNAFTPLSTVTGRILASSANGTLAVFSDAIHSPNQAYVVNSAGGTSPAVTALNITGASAAAVTPDGAKAFIFGFDDVGNPRIYIYSTLQGLQTIALPAQTSVTSLAFSPNDAFLYVAESVANGATSNLTAISTCNNLVAGTVALPSVPLFMRVLPSGHVEGQDSHGNSLIDGIHIMLLDDTGFDIATAEIAAPPLGTLTQPGVLCPQTLTFVSNDPSRLTQRVELNQGTLQPVNFFVSGDGTVLYVPSANLNSILVYSFTAKSVSGIQLLGPTNPTPVSADMSVDAGIIVVAASDGQLHQINTALGGSDAFRFTFTDLPNSDNPFCTVDPAPGPCALNFAGAKP